MSLIPQSATLYVTNHCQFSCEHCFLTNSKLLNKNHLEFSQVQRIIDDFVRHKIFMGVISGGDPFLYPYFYDVIKK